MGTVEYVCENCQRDNRAELRSELKNLTCRHCGQSIDIHVSQSMQHGEQVDRCVICDRIRFYLQKDFNPRLGIFIFVLGVAFSYHTYFISLIVATLIDFILYKVLKTVTICYHCRAVYRGFKEDPTHRGFDHNLAMTLVEKEKKAEPQSAQSAAGVKG